MRPENRYIANLAPTISGESMKLDPVDRYLSSLSAH